MINFNSFISESISEYEVGRIINLNLDFIGSTSLPSIITNKQETEDGWVVYDIIFWSNSRLGEMSGYLEIKNICIWRYTDNEYNRLLVDILQNNLDTISNLPINYDKLHYIENNKKIYIKDECERKR
jgi:hypothetical protein